MLIPCFTSHINKAAATRPPRRATDWSQFASFAIYDCIQCLCIECCSMPIPCFTSHINKAAATRPPRRATDRRVRCRHATTAPSHRSESPFAPFAIYACLQCLCIECCSMPTSRFTSHINKGAASRPPGRATDRRVSLLLSQFTLASSVSALSAVQCRHRVSLHTLTRVPPRDHRAEQPIGESVCSFRNLRLPPVSLH
ncbi:hypothetical protein J6590_071499 [Homalodisca vitripennis]|nr:hypothetical protein J6590_071499 [Homalodisca vitripennis]